MYIGIPFVDALKIDPFTRNDALFLIVKFTNITILALVGFRVSNWASSGAVDELADILASLRRIDVPSGKEPRKTRAASVPRKFWMKMDTLGEVVEGETTLSIRRTVPLSSDTFVIVTVRFIAVGLAWTIAAMLRLIIMFPCAVTFTKATLVQDVLTVSFASGSAELVTVHGMIAIAGWAMTSMIITATCVFICLVKGIGNFLSCLLYSN